MLSYRREGPTMGLPDGRVGSPHVPRGGGVESELGERGISPEVLPEEVLGVRRHPTGLGSEARDHLVIVGLAGVAARGEVGQGGRPVGGEGEGDGAVC
jgi:hypothetical protein